MSVKLKTVIVTLASGKQILVDMQTQVMQSPNMSLKEIDETNRLLAKWERKHKL